MSNHPAFSPRLSRSNVEMILRYIDAEIQPPSLYPLQSEHVAARNEGLTKAAEIVRNMWLAAEIAAQAASQEFEETGVIGVGRYRPHRKHVAGRRDSGADAASQEFDEAHQGESPDADT